MKFKCTWTDPDMDHPTVRHALTLHGLLVHELTQEGPVFTGTIEAEDSGSVVTTLGHCLGPVTEFEVKPIQDAGGDAGGTN